MTTTQTKFCSIVFLQSDEATEALEILDESGEIEAINHLLNTYDYDDIKDKASRAKSFAAAGTDCTVYETETHILTYNRSLWYIGLEQKIITD